MPQVRITEDTHKQLLWLRDRLQPTGGLIRLVEDMVGDKVKSEKRKDAKATVPTSDN
jgi:hypothetical protein